MAFSLDSPKVHGRAVTTLDMRGIQPLPRGAPASIWGGSSPGSRGATAGTAASMTATAPDSRRQGRTANCLVVSGSIDRTICLFLGEFGKGLHLLRRLTTPCTPQGTPGSLIVRLPARSGGASPKRRGSRMEVRDRGPRSLPATTAAIDRGNYRMIKVGLFLVVSVPRSPLFVASSWAAFDEGQERGGTLLE